MTNQIIISDITIHKDAQGRYSLNDLHQNIPFMSIWLTAFHASAGHDFTLP